MSEPVIAAYKSEKINLVKGQEYYWCSCGRSKSQPYCDGSHQGTDLTPVKFVAIEDGIKSICMCKYTKTPPFCDGTHKLLSPK